MHTVHLEVFVFQHDPHHGSGVFDRATLVQFLEQGYVRRGKMEPYGAQLSRSVFQLIHSSLAMGWKMLDYGARTFFFHDCNLLFFRIVAYFNFTMFYIRTSVCIRVRYVSNSLEALAQNKVPSYDCGVVQALC